MDRDWQIRLAAFAHLNKLRERAGPLVRASDMQVGFEFEGERIPLFNEPVGIWRPRQLGRDGAALSITTAPRKPGKKPPYLDDIAEDSGELAYRYQRDGADNWMNRSVRQAFELGRPLIYFYGIEPGAYDAIYPIYVVGDEPEAQTFRLAHDPMAGVALNVQPPLGEVAVPRDYATREVKVRLHQRLFRAMVMRAYRTMCSVCRIRHNPLLDAAHILPDRDERGRPEVPNGLSLCKIHHAAFDANILGVTPDYVIRIRHDILQEHDGPMLEHGLQRLHDGRLTVPRSAELKPNQEYLAERYERFRAA